MDILFIGIICLAIIFLVLFLLTNKQLKNIKETKIEEFTAETKRRCEKLKKDKEREFQLFKENTNEKIKNLEKLLIEKEKVLSEKEKRYNEVNQDLSIYKKKRIEDIDNELSARQTHKLEMLQRDTEKAKKVYTEQITKVINEKETELEKIKEELEIERSKRSAINEELRKSVEKEKYNEIHSIQLTDDEKEDIHFLLTLEDRLHNKQPLYKLIWSTYLQQACKNTFNNILGSKNPKNVIYCIENINTGKKYIGKTSAEVSKRWTEHIKTSLNIGTIKTTNIHKSLFNHWDEFIFYIIMETEKDKLSEMEKYYINFYESDKCGYNIKSGG